MNTRAKLALGTALAIALLCAPSGAHAEPRSTYENDVLHDPAIAEHMMASSWAEVDRAIELRQVDKKALEAASQWHQGRDAAEPTRGQDGRVVYVYGATMPRVICGTLLVCNIEMQVGEVVYDVRAGDDEQWKITGIDTAPRQYVAVKPKAPNLLTNLTIYTDRRVYVLELVSSAEERAPSTQLISFTYPEDERAQWARMRARAAERNAKTNSKNKEADDTASSSDEYELHVRPGSLNFSYRVKKAGRWLNRKRTKWAPVRVYDDGAKTFIEMPQRMQETPVLVMRDGGQNAIANLRWKGRVLVVDRLFDKAMMMLGVGWWQQRVAITREGD